MKKIISIALLAVLVLTGCKIGSPGPECQVKVGFEYSLDAVFGGNAEAVIKSISAKGQNSFRGVLVAENLDYGVTQSVNWFAVIDEGNFTIKSSKTTSFYPGNYNFYLTLTKGTHQYYGKTLDVDLTDGKLNIPMVMKPVIGDSVADVDFTQVAALEFKYPADEFKGITAPKLGYSIDGGNETILSLVNGANDTYFNLSAGSHNIKLKLYDGSLQIGRSVTAQEDVTVVLTEDLSIDIVPLYAESTFNLSLQGGDAKFVVTIPEEIKAEVGSSANLDVVLNVTSGVNGPKEVSLSLTDESNGTVTGAYTFSGFRYDTVNLALTFKDKSNGDVIGTSAVENIVLSKNGSSITFSLEIIRRAVISGNLLAVLGINVFDANEFPVPNASIYINGELKGITGTGTFGTDGYLKLYSMKGNYTIKAVIDTRSAEQNVTLSSLGITGVDLFLNE